VHCVVEKQREYGNLSFKQIKNIISNIPLDHDITITGGEPTLRPEFLRIVKLCQNHNSIGLQTNGLGLNEMVVANLKQFKIHVLLTIHSYDKDTYLRVSQGPEDGYDKVVNAAKLLTKYEIPFTWQIVVHKLNLHTVLQTFRFAKLINPKVTLKFTNPHQLGNRDWKGISCSLTEMKPIVKQCCEEFKNDIWFEMIPFCFLDDHTDIMKKSGVFDPKDETLGVRFENNLNFDSYYMSHGRVKSKKCKECVYFDCNCPGVYTEYRELFGDEELEPVKNLPMNNIDSMQKNYMFEKFAFWLYTTTRCNARCAYCQQKENSEVKINKLLSNCNDMTEDNLRYIFEECIKAHEKGIVKLFTFNISGGEPFIMFNEFKNIIPEYRNKYPNLFSFNSSTNATLLDDEKLDWFLENLNNCLISLDSLRMSKPINGISSSEKVVEIINKINKRVTDMEYICCMCVYENQSIDEMLELAEYVINNIRNWRIYLSRPVHHTKEQILEVIKPVVKYLHDNNYDGIFDFEGWDLVNQINITGCPCGQTFLSIYPNLDVSPSNGENTITLGKFNWNIPELINHQDNTYYREDMRPDICSQCELRCKCDGSCKSNHKNPEMLKERCDAIKELFEYVKELNSPT